MPSAFSLAWLAAAASKPAAHVAQPRPSSPSAAARPMIPELLKQLPCDSLPAAGELGGEAMAAAGLCHRADPKAKPRAPISIHQHPTLLHKAINRSLFSAGTKAHLAALAVTRPPIPSVTLPPSATRRQSPLGPTTISRSVNRSVNRLGPPAPVPKRNTTNRFVAAVLKVASNRTGSLAKRSSRKTPRGSKQTRPGGRTGAILARVALALFVFTVPIAALFAWIHWTDRRVLGKGESEVPDPSLPSGMTGA